MKNLIIRKLETKDAEEISTIYADIIRQPLDEGFMELTRDHARSKKDACIVAEADGHVVGFLISYILTMGFGINKSAWIATMGVKPDYMGQGIGKKLAQSILEYYQTKGITDVHTSVLWDSPDMLSFFKTLGFDRSNFINLRKKLD